MLLGKSEALDAEAREAEGETEWRQLHECNVATSCVPSSAVAMSQDKSSWCTWRRPVAGN